MTDIQRAGDIVTELATARQVAPSEVAVAPDGTQAVIQWQGTPTSAQWLTAYVHKLMAAKLADPYEDAPSGNTPEAGAARAANAAKLDAWHRALSGLPMEGIEAARVHFERNGVPEGRWGYLRPYEVSRWVRARAQRRIPEGRACEAHPGEWAHDCGVCRTAGRVPPEKARGYIAQMRAELARRKETA